MVVLTTISMTKFTCRSLIAKMIGLGPGFTTGNTGYEVRITPWLESHAHEHSHTYSHLGAI